MKFSVLEQPRDSCHIDIGMFVTLESSTSLNQSILFEWALEAPVIYICDQVYLLLQYMHIVGTFCALPLIQMQIQPLRAHSHYWCFATCKQHRQRLFSDRPFILNGPLPCIDDAERWALQPSHIKGQCRIIADKAHAFTDQ